MITLEDLAESAKLPLFRIPISILRSSKYLINDALNINIRLLHKSAGIMEQLSQNEFGRIHVVCEQAGRKGMLLCMQKVLKLQYVVYSIG